MARDFLSILRSLGAPPWLIAHRGFSAVAPENTMVAFRCALEAGCSRVELDYHLSRDGVPVVMHDATLERTTDAAARWGQERLGVAERDWVELATLDAGQWFASEFTGERLPRLEDAIEFILEEGGQPVIERKAGSAEALATLLGRRGWSRRVVVQSFDWHFLERLRVLLPEVLLGALGPPESEEPEPPNDALEVRLKALGVQYVGWDASLAEVSVEAFHHAGLGVWIYTVDDPSETARLARMGVDGLITNNPVRLREALAWID